MEHPEIKGFYQCVTFKSFPDGNWELAYNTFCLFVLYGFPLMTIVITYSSMLHVISKTAQPNVEGNLQAERRDRSCGQVGRQVNLRRSDGSNIQKAKKKTLKLTTVIISAFIFCWTPYSIMTMWYMIDRKRAEAVDENLQKFIFMFAVSNSLINPIIYGSYVVNFRDEFSRLFRPCNGRVWKAQIVKPGRCRLNRLNQQRNDQNTTETSTVPSKEMVVIADDQRFVRFSSTERSSNHLSVVVHKEF
ncbi:GNRHR (predicted) [Pycnogonum litorale]